MQVLHYRVTAFIDYLEISPQRLSYHLSKLKEAGLIYERKEKNFIYYQLELSVLDQLVMWIMDLKGGVDSE